MKFKQMIAVLLVAAVCLFLLPGRVLAAELASGSCGDNLSWVLTEDGVLTISGSGEMYEYTGSSNPAPWMAHRSAIKSVIVKEGVTSISPYAFYLCENLQTVTMEDGVLSIGAGAFDSCHSLTKITMSDSIKTIGVRAFADCTSLQILKLPKNLKNIPSFMSRNCKNLKVLVISKTTYQIGRDAFTECNKLWHVLYTGTKSQWKRITIQGSVGNSGYCLGSATLHYKCSGNEVTDVENEICSICSGECDHAWSEGVVKTEPTCTENGQMRYTCNKCQEEKTETISALGHEYTSRVTAPTCTQQGYTVYTCSRCQETMTQDFTDPTGHSWDDGAVTKEATETAMGEMCFTCAACGDTRTEDIPIKEPAPTEPVPPTEPTSVPLVPTKPTAANPATEPSASSGSTQQAEQNVFTVIVIIAVLTLIAAGTGIFIVLKKRKIKQS